MADLMVVSLLMSLLSTTLMYQHHLIMMSTSL